jgi:hypothetical protein
MAMTREAARLILPKPMLRQLESGGIFCQAWVTAERQTRADRWVLRGVESAGATKEVGRYISFFSSDGKRLAWLQRMDRIGSNGVHAVVVAPELVSVEMARVGQTYQLLIVRHRLGRMQKRRPEIESTVLFRGIDGHLPDPLRAQGLAPEFFTRSGEIKPIPVTFVEAARQVAAGAVCVQCKHCHGLVAKGEEEGPQLGQVVSIASGGSG